MTRQTLTGHLPVSRSVSAKPPCSRARCSDHLGGILCKSALLQVGQAYVLSMPGVVWSCSPCSGATWPLEDILARRDRRGSLGTPGPRRASGHDAAESSEGSILSVRSCGRPIDCHVYCGWSPAQFSSNRYRSSNLDMRAGSGEYDGSSRSRKSREPRSNDAKQFAVNAHPN